MNLKEIDKEHTIIKGTKLVLWKDQKIDQILLHFNTTN
jgi:hypothetical protein